MVKKGRSYDISLNYWAMVAILVALCAFIAFIIWGLLGAFVTAILITIFCIIFGVIYQMK
jgi:hypothetical protein